MNQDSVSGRGLKTAVQATIGAAIVFSTGLITVINGVPGCGEAIETYVRANFFQLCLSFGVSSGLASVGMNLLRKDLPLK